ncbi:MAG: DEAD/DEAH box helicase, partial [Spirochaetia bacterium]
MQKVMKNTPVSRKHLLLGEEEDPMYTEQMKRFREMDQSVLHPAVLAWFTKTFRAPTDVQTRAWAKIAAGKHILMTAPTGSGKTLAAFLWAINQLISGKWPPGATRVLYISPLKALNSDIHKNLQIPLAGIIEEATRLGYSVPNIRTGLRSGDTTQSQRRKMVTTPPEILITTPESLNILLTTKKAEALFSSIETVILDEIHAVASTKRGVHLMSAIERLTLYSDEFQRIGVSATVRPMEAVAGFIGGHHILQEGHEPEYKKREVEIIRSTDTAKKDLTVCFPADAHMMMEDNSWWPVLVRDFKEIIKQRKSTLLFANNRRLTEKLTRLINEDEEEDIAYAHHGSLSKDIRRAVEERLKKGELKAIVATSSLELGIDVGALDQVILVQTPPSISSAMQRLGRAGHQVGALSRGILYPSHGRDFLLAAVCSNAVKEGEIEKSTPISAPLDVLTQIILSMTAHTQWDIDRLYHFIRTISSYRGLPRKQYDLVLQMLAGRYENTRVRELSKRIILDEVENTIIGRPANPMLIYSSGGTIPDRGYYELRVQGSGAKIGELDEEFVWERKIGESFVLGTHKWKITAIDNQKVEVVPWSGRITSNPFWRADAQYRDFTFSERILGFLEKADTEVHENSFPHTLMKEYKMDQESAGELISYLLRQKEHTNTSLPHRHHIVIEHTSDAAGSQEGRCVIIHTLWGGKVNQPVSMALSAALEERYKEKLQVSADDDCIMVYFPDQYEKDTDYLSLIEPNQLLPLVRKRLESSGLFGARFRENAGVALLLPKNGFNKRMPLWLTRLRSKKLYDAVLDLPDFPVLLETWRTCLQDWFDLNTAEMLLEEVHSGEIRVSETETPNPSPFSSNMLWRQINHQMYLDDTPTTSRTSKLDDELIHQAVGYLPSEYAVSKTHVQHLTAKLQRTFPGYQPSDTGELIDWIKQRVFIPVDEYVKLYHSLEESRIDEEKLAKRIVTFSFQGADTDCVCEKNTFSEIYHACLQAGTELPEGPQMSSTPKETDRDILTLLSEYIQYYGPIQYNHLVSVIGSRNAGEILSPEPTAETQVLAGKLIKEDNENLIGYIHLIGNK